MPYEVRVISTSEVFLPDDNGKFVKHKRVSFKVGDDGPFTKDFPADGFNASSVKLALDAEARELKALKGVV